MSNKYSDVVKQSNFIPKSNQDLDDHLTMVDRDLQHLFNYVTSIVPYTETVSSTASSLYASKIKSGYFTYNIATVGTSVTTGLGFTPTNIFFWGGVDSTGSVFWGSDNISTRIFVSGSSTNVFTVDVAVAFRVYTNSTTYAYSYVNSLDSDGFTLSWDKVGSPTGTVQVNYMAFK